jgi:hypothetical protein
MAQLLGVPDVQYTARQMGYDLRRLSRKGLLWREGRRLRYELTPYGRWAALILTNLHGRLLRLGLQALDPTLPARHPTARRIDLQQVDTAVSVMLQ